jgi:rod shape-determining protein MreC
MRKLPLQAIGILVILFLGIALLDAYALHGRVANFFTRGIATPASYLWEKTRVVTAWTNGIKGWGSLIQENNDLKRTAADLTARAAKVDELERENEFLRSAGKISARLPVHLIPAGIFAIGTDAAGHHALLNVGRDEGIMVGDVVVAGEGALVGQVQEVLAATARVRLVTDPGFEITGRVMGGLTTGIVRGNLSHGLVFDLIAQEDVVIEGDFIISSGNDRFPAGLVIGTVEHVAVNEGKLFKDVRITPAMNIVGGRVVVLHTE